MPKTWSEESLALPSTGDDFFTEVEETISKISLSLLWKWLDCTNGQTNE